MSTISRDYTDNLDCAVPATTRIGISDQIVENPGFVMVNFSIPPKGRTRRHFNVNADLAMYKVRGQGRLLVGPDHQLEEMDFSAEDFAYVHKGEIYCFENVGDESDFVIFTYIGVSNIEEAQEVYIEPPVA